MFDAIATVLAWFFSLVDSYAFAITMLTLVVMALTAPLTYKGTKSMIQMQRLQPQMKAIQTRYKDDREKMNQELLAFYRKNNINPLGGCLPLLIQAPVFIVLFRVLSGLTSRLTDVGTQAGVTVMNFHQTASFQLADLSERRNFNPSYVSEDSDLYQSLVNTNEMGSLGIDLSRSASSVLSDSVVDALPFLGLILVVLVTGLIQTWQIQGRLRSSGTSPVNSQQQLIMKIMPFFLPVFSFGLPAGLVVYFVVSNVWRIGQQAVITRRLYSGGQAAPVEPIEFDDEDEEDEDDDQEAVAIGDGRRGGSSKAGAVSKTRSSQPASRRRETTPAADRAVKPSQAAMGRNRRAVGAREPEGIARSGEAPRAEPEREPARKAREPDRKQPARKEKEKQAARKEPARKAAPGRRGKNGRREEASTSSRTTGRVTPRGGSAPRSRKRKRN